MCEEDKSEMIHEARPVYSISEMHWPDEPMIVERAGRPTAVIISLEEYRRFAAWCQERAARRAWVLERDPRGCMPDEQWRAQFAAMDRFATHFADTADEELTNELAQAVATVRAERVHK